MQLQFDSIERPKIDIEYYGTESNVPPMKHVQMMDEDTFEQFILEWLYACKSQGYASIRGIGGAGDKGRDVIGYYDDGSVDYYQCKHYSAKLAPTEFYPELGKLCYYCFEKAIQIPRNYFIVASCDIGPALNDLIKNPPKLKMALMKNWEKYCKSRITTTKEIKMDNEFKCSCPDSMPVFCLN